MTKTLIPCVNQEDFFRPYLVNLVSKELILDFDFFTSICFLTHHEKLRFILDL